MEMTGAPRLTARHLSEVWDWMRNMKWAPTAGAIGRVGAPEELSPLFLTAWLARE